MQQWIRYLLNNSNANYKQTVRSDCLIRHTSHAQILRSTAGHRLEYEHFHTLVIYCCYDCYHRHYYYFVYKVR